MSEWISVEDKFPNETGYYLIHIYRYCDEEGRKKYGYATITIIAPFNKGSNYFLGHESKHNPATHWMPLPNPPESREE